MVSVRRARRANHAHNLRKSGLANSVASASVVYRCDCRRGAGCGAATVSGESGRIAARAAGSFGTGVGENSARMATGLLEDCQAERRIPSHPIRYDQRISRMTRIAVLRLPRQRWTARFRAGNRWQPNPETGGKSCPYFFAPHFFATIQSALISTRSADFNPFRDFFWAK